MRVVRTCKIEFLFRFVAVVLWEVAKTGSHFCDIESDRTDLSDLYQHVDI